MSQRFKFLHKGYQHHRVQAVVDNNGIFSVHCVLRSMSYAIIMIGGLFFDAQAMQPQANDTIVLNTRPLNFGDFSSLLSIMPDPARVIEEQDKNFVPLIAPMSKSMPEHSYTSLAQKRADGILKRRFLLKKCPQCSFACKDRIKFIQHIYEHNSIIVKCPVTGCGHTEKNIDTLAHHLKNEHTKPFGGASYLEVAAESYKKALEESRTAK